MGYFRNSICESFLRKHDFAITKIKTKKSFKASDLRAKHRYNKVNIKKRVTVSGICISIKVKEETQGSYLKTPVSSLKPLISSEMNKSTYYAGVSHFEIRIIIGLLDYFPSTRRKPVNYLFPRAKFMMKSVYLLRASVRPINGLFSYLQAAAF